MKIEEYTAKERWRDVVWSSVILVAAFLLLSWAAYDGGREYWWREVLIAFVVCVVSVGINFEMDKGFRDSMKMSIDVSKDGMVYHGEPIEENDREWNDRLIRWEEIEWIDNEIMHGKVFEWWHRMDIHLSNGETFQLRTKKGRKLFESIDEECNGKTTKLEGWMDYYDRHTWEKWLDMGMIALAVAGIIIGIICIAKCGISVDN